MKHVPRGLLVAAMLVSAPSVALAAPPAITTGHYEMNWDQNRCLLRGRAALEAVGFGNIGVDFDSWSATGVRGDYTGVVRCDARRKLVVITTAGPSFGDALLFLNAIRGSFAPA